MIKTYTCQYCTQDFTRLASKRGGSRKEPLFCSKKCANLNLQAVAAEKRGDKLWTEEEVRILRDNYYGKAMIELIALLPHPAKSISLKAHRLGLRANRNLHYRGNSLFVNGNPYQDALSQGEIGYIAGLIDGEGSIASSYAKNGKEIWETRLSSTTKPLIDWLANKVIYSRVHPIKARKANWKNYWTWCLSGNFKVKALLELVLPHLIVKKVLALECLEAIAKGDRNGSFCQRDEGSPWVSNPGAN